MRGLPIFFLCSCADLVGANFTGVHPEETGGASNGEGGADSAGGQGGACDADLANDGHNCGACDVDCLGGECKLGACEPFVLASMLSVPEQLALDASYVYCVEPQRFSDDFPSRDGRVLRVPSAGCDNPEGCVEILKSDLNSPSSVGVNSEYLFVAEHGGLLGDEDGAILRMALPNGEFEVLAAGEAGPRKLAPGKVELFDEGVYWITGGSSGANGQLRYYNGSFGTLGTLVTDLESPVRLAYREGDLFWTNYGHSSSTGSVERFSDEASFVAEDQYQPIDLAIGSTYTYWVNNGNGTIMRAETTPGGQRTILASDRNSPYAVALDSEFLYWTEAGTEPYYTDGRVVAYRLSDGAITVLAEEQTKPVSIAVDEEAVYWVNQGTPLDFNGSIVKMAKPRQ